MSINEQNGIITLMRGDSFTMPIKINIGSKLSPRYKILGEGDVVYFGLMEPNQAFEDAVLKKRYDRYSPTDASGNVLLTIRPTDTEKLLVGKYYYMIKWLSVDDFGVEQVRTIVKPTLFWLEGNNPVDEDVYYDEGVYDVDKVIFEGGEIV